MVNYPVSFHLRAFSPDTNYCLEFDDNRNLLSSFAALSIDTLEQEHKREEKKESGCSGLTRKRKMKRREDLREKQKGEWKERNKINKNQTNNNLEIYKQEKRGNEQNKLKRRQQRREEQGVRVNENRRKSQNVKTRKRLIHIGISHANHVDCLKSRILLTICVWVSHGDRLSAENNGMNQGMDCTREIIQLTIAFYSHRMRRDIHTYTCILENTYLKHLRRV